MTKQELIKLVEKNKSEISKKLNVIRLEEIRIDDLGDVGAIGIYIDEDDYEMEVGFAFSINDDLGEGDDNGEIVIGENIIYYIGYNI